MIVASEDPSFLATWANKSLNAGLLVWPTKIMIVTRHSVSQLDPLNVPFAQANALTLSCPSTARSVSSTCSTCDVWSYLPYSLHQVPVVLVAQWSTSSGFTNIGHVMLFPDKFYQ
ncbi:hypothetical protein Pcinc_003386 [Petrolisthes cinctipes]|uniref:Uncharacterized protein n=1 Tax=Petrolisthes cinctipes TaxID=88211 RepID=A0AAE1GHU9_PETCI|nr:hypothetical protein Pcinc_003355 [Petrolisthes cinctipes]KAK3892798.1 hypothetical protein Pcinc_003386 [Petrolisthes cinctipes]